MTSRLGVRVKNPLDGSYGVRYRLVAAHRNARIGEGGETQLFQIAEVEPKPVLDAREKRSTVMCLGGLHENPWGKRHEAGW